MANRALTRRMAIVSYLLATPLPAKKMWATHRRRITMADGNACCKIKMNSGGIMGGMIAFSLGVWAAIRFVQPVFVGMDGLSENDAYIITATIALLGPIELVVSAGVVAGAVAWNHASCGYPTFFTNNSNQRHTAALTEISVPITPQAV